MSYEGFMKYTGTGKAVVGGIPDKVLTEQRSQHFILIYHAEGVTSYCNQSDPRSVGSAHLGMAGMDDEWAYPPNPDS